MNKKLTISALLLVVTILFLPSISMAGQPWKVNVVEKNGEPVRWPYNSSSKKWILEWYVDPGPLVKGADPAHDIDSRTAVEDWIMPMLNDWEGVSLIYKVGKPAVKTTAIDFVYKGLMTGVDTDIDVRDYTNFTTDRDDIASPPPPVVIFDPDGSIIKDICLKGGDSEEYCECVRGGSVATDGEGKPICGGSMVGQAYPFPDSRTKVFKSGYIILNGRMIDGISTANNQEMDPGDDGKFKGFRAVIKHEFGHLLNLDHSQINIDIAERCRPSDEAACSTPTAIGTMYPSMKNSNQYSLHMDDQIAISFLYPTQDFLDKFCMIKGTILDSAGKPMQGVNVLASNMDGSQDIRAFVSGALYPPGSENGDYVLAGIVPGEQYGVRYEELLEDYNAVEGSEFGPLGKDSPTGFGSGTIAGPGGSATVACKEGGEIIEMPAKKMFAGGDDVSNPTLTTSENRFGKGWCQLQSNRFFSGKEFLFYFAPFFFFFSLLIFRRCKVKIK